jgi:large subunit ribosomal protein L7/L12
MAANIESLVESISKLTVLEASELYTQLKEKLNLPDVVAAAPAAAAGGAAAPAAEAKSAFDVVLTDGGSNKIAVIKEVRALVSGLGLAEAKALVEGAPKPLLTGVPEAQAKEAAEKIKAAGGKAEVK